MRHAERNIRPSIGDDCSKSRYAVSARAAIFPMPAATAGWHRYPRQIDRGVAVRDQLEFTTGRRLQGKISRGCLRPHLRQNPA
jgi:hypothetical protein